MRIEELSKAIEATLIVATAATTPEIVRVFGGSTISDLMANAANDTLLITSLNNTQLVRVAELMDVPGICLVDGCQPTPDLVSQARAAGTALLVSRSGLAETCARAQASLAGERAGRR